MQAMSINRLVALCVAVFPLLAIAAGNPFHGDAKPVSKPLPVPYTVGGHVPPGGTIAADTPDPRVHFVNPLSVYMRTVWPEEVTTVRQAVVYLLEPTGYRLTTEFPAPREAALLVDKPLPPIARIHRTMPVLDALQLLTGLDNTVIVDPAHRLVSFQTSRARP